MENPEKTAIITGGGQGIGRAIAGRFLRVGMKVVIAETDREAGEETAAELAGKGEVYFIPCDVSDEEAVRSMVEKTLERFGGIDILVNNAAISNNKPIEELSFAEWNRVVAVNLSGAFLCSKYCARHLKSRRGAIVNMASTRAFMSEAHTEAYSASKGGIFALTHALSISLGPAVRVNCISPGWIETRDWQKKSRRAEVSHRPEDRDQHPAGRVGKPEDIAGLAYFLVSKESGFITGANFFADGGMTRKMIYV